MYKDVLRSISEVEWFPIVSIVIFFVFFMIVLFYTLRMDKPHVRRMSEMPLEEPKDELKAEISFSENGVRQPSV